MPELPEVEVTRQALAAALLGRPLKRVLCHAAKLRYPVPADLHGRLAGRPLVAIARRGKYLLFDFALPGRLLVHLGMSGRLRLLPLDAPVRKHDHVDLDFDHWRLRLTDPRRFGALLWLEAPVERHPLLAGLGPEPLDDAFDAVALGLTLRRRRGAIKPVLMDAHVVAGLGNIYAAEALHRAGIDPRRPAGELGDDELVALTEALRATLREAIAAGGSSLRDYTGPDGRLGHFALQHRVYGRAGQACPRCGATIEKLRQANRSTFYCPGCQK